MSLALPASSLPASSQPSGPLVLRSRSPRPAPAASASGELEPQSEASGGTALDSKQILRGQKAVEIRHNGLVYRLQATRLGKLILTK